jgi:hypothetical protein
MRNGSTVGLSQSSGAGWLRNNSWSGIPRLRSILLKLRRGVLFYVRQGGTLSVKDQRMHWEKLGIKQ